MLLFYYDTYKEKQICQWYISNLTEQSHKYLYLGEKTHQLLSCYQDKLSSKTIKPNIFCRLFFHEDNNFQFSESDKTKLLKLYF